MTLSFPNASRRFDPTRQIVCFWGYDTAFEVSFFVGSDALARIRECSGEAEMLRVFDDNRQRIHAVAAKAYARHRGNYLGLKPTDF